MGVYRHLNIGWYVEFPKGTNVHDVEEKMMENGFRYEELLIGIDPICGDLNHIAVPNFKDLTLSINSDDDTTIIRWDRLVGLERKRPDKLVEYINNVNSVYGDDFATLRFGVIQWFN
jgi:hypothetical protein